MGGARVGKGKKGGKGKEGARGMKEKGREGRGILAIPILVCYRHRCSFGVMFVTFSGLV